MLILVSDNDAGQPEEDTDTAAHSFIGAIDGSTFRVHTYILTPIQKAKPEKSALPQRNYQHFLYQFFAFTQNLGPVDKLVFTINS